MPHTKPWRTTVSVYDRRIQERVVTAVTVEIDWQALADQFAEKACRNKSGKSVQCNGAVIVRCAP